MKKITLIFLTLIAIAILIPIAIAESDFPIFDFYDRIGSQCPVRLERNDSETNHVNEKLGTPDYIIIDQDEDYHVINGIVFANCTLCGRTYHQIEYHEHIAPHSYNYDKPQKRDDDHVRFYCELKNWGCNGYKDHTHDFVYLDDKEIPEAKTRPIPGNTKKHERRFRRNAKCRSTVCKEDTAYVWRPEDHSFTIFVEGTSHATNTYDIMYDSPNDLYKNHRRYYSINAICEECEMPGESGYWDVEPHNWDKSAVPWYCPSCQLINEHNCQPDFNFAPTLDSNTGKYYRPCIYKNRGCKNKVWVKKDNCKNHELTLGTIASTGPSSALGGRQQYCRYCGATECEIYGCDYSPATCTDPQICSKCGKTSGTKLGHLYDYDHPQEENTYVVKFFCKRPGCTDYTAHSHCYADVGDPKKTENIRKHNDAKHQREYDILQECQSTLGNGQKCTASYWRFYEWREESHTMNPVGDPVMKGAYQFSSSDSRYKTKHMRKYEQNYMCKCGYEAVREDRKDEAHSWHKEVVKAATCTTDGTKTRICAGCDYVDTVLNGKALGHLYDYNNPWEQSPNLVLFRCKRNGCTSYEAHSHTFVDTGADPKPTSKYRKIADNYSKHERKYEVPQKCSYSKCKATNTGTLWKKESHIWDGWNTTKTPTCVSVGSEQRTCTMCDITQKKDIPIDKSNHKWPAITSCTAKQKCTRSGCTATRTPGHRLDSGTVTKSPTCSSTGTKLFKCTRSGCTHTETASLATIGHIYTGVNNRCKFCGKPKNVEVQ